MAADMFMKIDTIEGEAKDAKHKKEKRDTSRVPAIFIHGGFANSLPIVQRYYPLSPPC